jgi:hypothetical protein
LERFPKFRGAEKIPRWSNGAKRLGLRQSSAALGIMPLFEKRQRTGAVQNLAALLIRIFITRQQFQLNCSNR